MPAAAPSLPSFTCCAPLPKPALAAWLRQGSAGGGPAAGFSLPPEEGAELVLYLGPRLWADLAQVARTVWASLLGEASSPAPRARAGGAAPGGARGLFWVRVSASGLRLGALVRGGHGRPGRGVRRGFAGDGGGWGCGSGPVRVRADAEAVTLVGEPSVAARIVLPSGSLEALGRWLQRQGSGFDAVGRLFAQDPNTGRRAATGVITGWSSPLGEALVVPLRRDAAVLRWRSRLRLAVGAHLPEWQRLLQRFGGSWGVTRPLHREGADRVPCLALTVPRRVWPPSRASSGGARGRRLLLCLAVGPNRVVLANGRRLARRLAAHRGPLLRTGDAGWPGSRVLEGAAPATETLWLAGVARPDDPLFPPRSVGADSARGAAPRASERLWEWVARSDPLARRVVAWARLAADLLARVRVRARRSRAGGCLSASLTLAHGTGAPLKWPASYLSLILHKHAGHRAGLAQDLRRVAAKEPESPAGRKARRLAETLAEPRTQGVFPWLARGLLPLLEQRLLCARLAAAVDRVRWISMAIARLARRAGPPGTLARRRVLRGFAPAPPTAVRPGCAPIAAEPGSALRHPSWRRLGFAPTAPVCFRYWIDVQHRPTRSRFVIHAEGDPIKSGVALGVVQWVEIRRRDGGVVLGPVRRLAPKGPLPEAPTCIHRLLERN